MKVINQKTLVPLGMSVFIVGGAAFWLSSLQALAQVNKETLHHVINKQTAYNTCIMDIKSDIAEIKGELKRIRK